jgi:transposase
MKQFDTCVGIDLARRAKHKAVIIREDEAGRTVPKRAWAFSHDLDGFQALRDRVLKQTGAASLKGVAVNLEPTSGVWETVGAFFKSQGAEVYFTRPDVVSQLRKVHSKFAKTDRIDARTLASVPFSFPERLIPVVNVERRLRVLRNLSGQRQRLVEDLTRWKNRFTAKAEVVWAALLAQLGDEQRFCALGRAFFTTFTDPRKVMRYGHERFTTWCRKKAHGNTDPGLANTLWQGARAAARLWDELERSAALQVDWETLAELLAQDLRLIGNLEKEIKHVDKRIQEARRDVPECDVMEQLPGVGKVIAVTLASILMPVDRFANTNKCGAYTGFTSRQKGSSGREIEGLKITKSGNRRLKRDLALAADVAMKIDPELAVFAIRLLEAGKHYNKVRVAVGRKIAVRAYSLLKRFQAGQTNVQYLWRDLHGNTITRQQAMSIARELWALHKADVK